MKDKILKVFFIIFCGLISFILFGCTQDGKIKFYRESALNQTLEDVKNTFQQQDTVTKSSGIVIYKDNSEAQKNRQAQGVAFGPKDIDFDLPVKFK